MVCEVIPEKKEKVFEQSLEQILSWITFIAQRLNTHLAYYENHVVTIYMLKLTSHNLLPST